MQPIKDGRRPMNAMVLVGVLVDCLKGCFRARPPWSKKRASGQTNSLIFFCNFQTYARRKRVPHRERREKLKQERKFLHKKQGINKTRRRRSVSRGPCRYDKLNPPLQELLAFHALPSLKLRKAWCFEYHCQLFVFTTKTLFPPVVAS